MRTLTALSITALLASVISIQPVFASAPSGETTVSNQPFAHPSNDASYSADVQQDMSGKGLREDEAFAKIKPEDNGKVQYISGGIGESGFRAIDAEAKAYNLKILFAAGGAYLADVAVHIKNGKGEEVLSTTTHGPVLLVKMSPGIYTVETKTAGGAMLTRHVKVGKDYLTSYVLRYPTEK